MKLRVNDHALIWAMLIDIGEQPDIEHAAVFVLDDVELTHKLAPLLAPKGSAPRWLELALGPEPVAMTPVRGQLVGLAFERRITATFSLAGDEDARRLGTLLYQRIRIQVSSAELDEPQPEETPPMESHHIGLGIATAWARLRANERAQQARYGLGVGARVEHRATGRFGGVVSVRVPGIAGDPDDVAVAIDGSPLPLIARSHELRIVSPAPPPPEPPPSAEQMQREHAYFEDHAHAGDGDDPGVDDGPWHDGDGR